MSSYLKYQYHNIINNYYNNLNRQRYTQNIKNKYDKLNIKKKNIKNFINNTKILDNDKTICNKMNTFLGQLHRLNIQKRLEILTKLPIIKTFNNEHNYSKSVDLLENYIVRKTLPYTALGYHLFNNEIKALIKLSNYSHFPQLIAFDTQRLTIYMTYCGCELSSSNIPENWLEQFKEIKHVLETMKVNSNDMLIRNTCILDNKIYIIDFGLDNIYNDSIKVVLNKFLSRLTQLSRKFNYK